MLPDPQHFDRICRICLSSSEQLIDLFSSDEDFLNIFVSITAISISSNDNLPRNICPFCSHQIKSTQFFILKCQESDRKLRTSLLGASENQINDPITRDAFSNDTQILNDASSKNISDSFHCLKCLREFATSNLLLEHSKMHCKNESVEHIVEESESALETSSQPQNICHICNKTFARLKNLERHTKTHETKVDDFQCKICGKQTKHINHFKIHMRTHKNVNGNVNEPAVQKRKQFMCSTCGRACTSRSNLAVHTRRHTGKMTNFCEICGKGYPRSTDLTIHMRKHTGEKPFTCKICSRGFARSDKLTIHLRTHTGEKPYGCTGCSRNFAQKNDLISHQKRNVCGGVASA